MDLREKGQVGQVLCTCGRVGELRTRNNGKRLPYLMCKHCGLKQGKDALRAEWLLAEDKTCSLGIYGEFPEGQTSNITSETVESEQVTTSSSTSSEWVPPENLTPETVEPETDATPDNTGDTSKKGLGILPKVGIGLLTAVCFAFGVKNINLARKIKG